MRSNPSPGFLVAAKTFLAGAPGLVAGLVVWRYPSAPHVVYTSIAIATALCTGLIWIIAKTDSRRERRREQILKGQVEKAARVAAVLQSALDEIALDVHKLQRSPRIEHVREMISRTITAALRAVYVIVNPNGLDGPAHTRATLLRPMDDRSLRITEWHDPSAPPSTLGHRFEIGDSERETGTSSAGWLWHAWKRDRLTNFVIPNVPAYLSDQVSTKKRKFEIINHEDLEKIKSILCLPVTYDGSSSGKVEEAEFHGVLSLDSDIPDHFGETGYHELDRQLRPLIRLIVIASKADSLIRAWQRGAPDDSVAEKSSGAPNEPSSAPPKGKH